MNYINYFKHTLFLPNIYHREFELDTEAFGQQAKKVALIALPFIGLYRPAGAVLSVSMGSVRGVSHLSQALTEQRGGQWKEMSLSVAQATLAAIAVAGTFFHFTTGLFITTSADGLQNAWNTCAHILKGEYSAAGEKALHTLGNLLYLSFMVTGSLEALLVFTLVQATISLYGAKKEIGEGNYLEAAAKIAMAGIQIHRAHGYVRLIERRDFLFKMDKYKKLLERALNGRRVRGLIEHPLNDLQGTAEAKRLILTDANGKEYDFGAHVHGFGQALVKGDNLTFRVREIDGQEILELEFKVNHAFRDKIDEAMKQARGWSTKEAREILSLTGSHVEGVNVSHKEQNNGMFWVSDITERDELHLAGLGTISVGAADDVPNLYDKVTIRMDKSKTIYDLHEMISFLDLTSVLAPSTEDDFERMKLGQLFRTFFPGEATPFERTEEFFQLSIPALKEKMIEKAPEMKGVLDQFLEGMKPLEILPGRVRYQMDGLAEAAYAKGARALTAALTGAHSDKELFERAASILKMGMLSTETRDSTQMSEEGLSKYWDYMSGGADSVFTQLLTEKDCANKTDFTDASWYWSKVRLVISLKALETGSYQYHEGHSGSRKTESGGQWWWDDEFPYLSRPGILEFIEQEQNSADSNRGHELMLKERLDPSLIRGMIVPDSETRDGLLEALRNYGVTQRDALGAETILNIPVDQFIRVGTQITEELVV